MRPTERAALQTANIARRLMRGSELHQAMGAYVGPCKLPLASHSEVPNQGGAYDPKAVIGEL
jgi:hypothetical protein